MPVVGVRGGNLPLFLLRCNIYLRIGFPRFTPVGKLPNLERSVARKAHSPAVFPAPGHDHGRCASDAIAHAETVCAARKERLTPIRRQVLEALLESHQPLGAYELIDRLAESGARPAPITVYRALDFLMANGLVHRIESRNAYLACAAHDHDSTSAVAFLICERCGLVGEISSASFAKDLNAAARSSGFAPKLSVVEITGVCTHCRKAD